MKKNKNRQGRGKPTSNRTGKPIRKQSTQVTNTQQLSLASNALPNPPTLAELIAQDTEDPIRLNPRLIIWGIGGIGKSSLMLKQAADVAQSLPSSIQSIPEEKAEEKFIGRDILIEKSLELFRHELELRRQQSLELHESDNS